MSIEMEKNIESRRETDRFMWFSMWFLLSIITFGVAWILMVYFLVKRRNAHFSRQEMLENIVLSQLKRLKEEKQTNYTFEMSVTQNHNSQRNAYMWALSTILIIPIFYVVFILNHDLQRHEERERAFVVEAAALSKELGFELSLNELATRKFSLDSYVIISIMTFGIAAVYWLYRVFNDYNRHFKRQWKLEDELLDFLKPANMPQAG